ncbi:hypothetical protein [Candidatus Absconditicoccus praedator]|uniref:hypothetical protein n=1 Tax=Candidatus Absconditicoccus praedator TaxID=2735562 RepID=UPI001E305279|nr:hypothetical protein [Candidatus Absconditicoccus praedator]UFX83207.1 hypothetical protein HLG78_03695 [Candidatus Absconditicoccus praedator]
MKKITFLLISILLFSFNFAYAENGDDEGDDCDGISLNTHVPFIGNCIGGEGSDVEDDEIFPFLIGGMTKILVTVVIVVGFFMLVAGGVMITMSGADQSAFSTGKDLIIRVLVGIFLLGASGVILYMLNPNFFG